MDPATCLALIPGMPAGASSLSSQAAANSSCLEDGLTVFFALILALWFSAGMERWYSHITGRNRKGR